MLLGLYQKKIGAMCWEKEQRWVTINGKVHSSKLIELDEVLRSRDWRSITQVFPGRPNLRECSKGGL
jgi:hypothetical protein